MLERFFGLKAAGTSVRTEVVAGSTTFLTMAYIIFVQPAVLSGALTGSPTGMDFGAVTVATCLAAALATAVMGLYARFPVAQAPGMGQNFFFVLSIIPAVAATGHPEPWRAALGVVFVAGMLFLLLSVLGVRQLVIDALSTSMKSAIGAGIGVFIAFVGLQNAAVIVRDPGTAVSLTAALQSPDSLLFFFGLTVTSILYARRVPAALLLGMVSTLVAALVARALLVVEPGGVGVHAGSMLMTRFEVADRLVAVPPSMAPTFLRLDVTAALSWELLPLVLLVLFMDMFDTIGTLVAVAQRAELIRGGRLLRSGRAMVSDAIGTVSGAVLGTSTVTSYVESVAGVEQGGRTGLTAVVAAGLFLLALPLTPLIAMIGSYPPITAPVLVIVGALMMRSVTAIDWDDATEALPAFLTLIGIPLTYSIADGIALGLIAYPILKLSTGRGDEANWLSRLLAIVLAGYFVLLRPQIA